MTMTPDATPTSPDVPRKRPRSHTESAQEHTATHKRGAPEDQVKRSPPDGLQASSSTHADIDAYMVGQGERDPTPLDFDVPPTMPERSTTAPSIPEPYDQLMSIRALKSKPLVEGDVWFLVSKKWYSRWEDACTGRVSKESSAHGAVGPMDNTDITQIDPYPGKEYDLVLDPPVMEGDTAEFIPKLAHEFLEQWLGPAKYPHEYIVTCADGSPPTIEIYPRRLRIYHTTPSQSQPPVYISVSRNLPLSHVLQNVEFGPDMDLYRAGVDRPWGDLMPLSSSDFWQNSGDRRLLLRAGTTQAQLGKSVAEALLESGDSLVALRPLALKADPPIFSHNNDYFRKLEVNHSSSSSSTATATTAKEQPTLTSRPGFHRVARTKGTVGLTNLGNTCFMNSALQCLAHLPELTEYFLRNVYKTELNPDNPLSTGGVLARSYGDLINNLFAEGALSTYAPRDFKHRISMHAPQFSGYAQHDSQELLAFLLDGLHEDLNRVLKKPYVEKPEWQGGGAKEFLKLARDSWEGYVMRNDSVIVDLFQGQYKSTLVCPECSKVSITFDPFMYLTLPLPIKRMWKHEIFYIPWDSGEANVSTVVELPYNSPIRVLKQKLAALFDSDAARLFATDFWHGKWYRVYSNSDLVSEIQPNDKTVVYELPISLAEAASSKNPHAPLILPVYHVVHEEFTRFTSFSTTYRRSTYNHSDKLFGIPTFVLLDQSMPINQEAIYSAVLTQYRRWTSRSEHLFQWEAADTPNASCAVDSDLANGHSDLGADAQTPTDAVMSSDTDLRPTLVGPKPNLFKVTLCEESDIRQRSRPPNTISLSYDGNRPISWADRRLEPESDEEGSDITETEAAEGVVEEGEGKDTQMHRATSLVPVQLKPSDMLRCEWDPLMLEYYFGSQGGGDGALWERFTPYTDPEVAAQLADASAQGRAPKKNITIEDCLDEFTREELLGEEDLWYCPTCKKHQQATKQFQLWKVPDVLVVHLKRFSNSRSLRDKIDAMVEFPVEGLDLSQRIGERQFGVEYEKETGSLEGTGLEHVMGEPVIYDLFAVDEHMGGLGGGHYRAYALNQEDEQWYHFDDSHVSKASPEDAVNASAYLLFYRRRSNKPIGGKTYEKLESAKLQSPASDEDDVVTQSVEPSQSQHILVSSTSSSTIAHAGTPFIGPLLPGYSDPSAGGSELPFFEQSLDDIAIPIRIDDEVEPGDRLAPSPSSSVDASSVRAEYSEDSGGENGAWIRDIGGGDGSAWPSTYGPGAIRRLSDASDLEAFGYSVADSEPTIDIDISSPPHSIE